MTSDPPGSNRKKRPSNIVERVAVLEERSHSTELFMDRVSKTLWITETLEAIAATIGGPLRKGIEMVIAAAIIYLLTHIRFAP